MACFFVLCERLMSCRLQAGFFPQARMAQITDKNLGTAKAYQMRLVLQDIYRSADAGTARHRLRIWCRWVRWAKLLRAQPHGFDAQAGENDPEPFARRLGSLEVGSDQRHHGRI